MKPLLISTQRNSNLLRRETSNLAMNIFLYTIIIFIIDSDLTFSENATLALNDTAIINIMTSKIKSTRQLNESEVLGYLYGDSNINATDHQLDISVFEPDEVKRLFGTAQSKGELMEREFNKSRRYYYTPGFIEGPYFMTKSLDFMLQSIHGTRYRLKDTKYIRRHFANDLAYKLAILYGSLMQLRLKMDNIYNTLYKFDREVKFVWHLVLYERVISVTVDANFIVERIFALAEGSKGENPKTP